jgi:hypothetical protein
LLARESIEIDAGGPRLHDLGIEYHGLGQAWRRPRQ